MIKNILIYIACIVFGIFVGVALTVNGKVTSNGKPILCFVEGGIIE